MSGSGRVQRATVIAVVGMLALGVAGCGGGSGGRTTVTETITTAAPAPVQKLVIGHRDPAAVHGREAGADEGPADCRKVKGGRVKTILLRSETASCFQVAPRDQLLFVNSTGIGPTHEEAEEVQVSVGGWEATVEVGQSALFPKPVGDYLGIGLHSGYTNGNVQRPSILVLPEGCAVSDPRAGESLCFDAGAPRCHGSELGYRAPMGGAGAGTYYQQIDVVNRSDRTCTVAGFPRLVALDPSGHPIGRIPTSGRTRTMPPARHPRKIALEPGAAAIFELNTGAAANYSRSACRPRKAGTLRISVPSSGPASKPIAYGMDLCSTGGNASAGPIE
jgi:Protein of unknown function (DUF4232)